jgi:hypothetical protein
MDEKPRYGIGDPVEVMFVIRLPSGAIKDEWRPATVVSCDLGTVGVAYANGMRQVFRAATKIIRRA